MEDSTNSARIERDAKDIGDAARDIGEQQERVAADVGKETELDQKMAALQHERAEVEADRAARRDREFGDERMIADRDRDLKEALGQTSGQQPAPPPVAGPSNPPVVPPRRVG